jgi:hypothetical protein
MFIKWPSIAVKSSKIQLSLKKNLLTFSQIVPKPKSISSNAFKLLKITEADNLFCQLPPKLTFI